ncbi:MAG: IS1595 family transposase [Thermaerobacter sp.]|jgi:hypothetical protein|nr:IS1595 family transposase [Thermaerobacter sp.]
MRAPEITLAEFQEKFRREADCQDFLFKRKWPDGFRCPACGNDTYWAIHKADHLLYECRRCRHQTSLTAGTIFHRTRLPLWKWLWAIFFVARDKRGHSALALKKDIQVNYKGALRMLRRIRSAMAQRDAGYTLGGLPTEVDDAYFGGQDRDSGHCGRGTTQVPVLVAITLGSAEGEYPEFLRMLPLKKLDRPTVEAALKKMVEPGSELKTDGLSVYSGLEDAGYQHERIVMAGLSPQAHFRWVHIAISNAKAFIDGTFHGVTKQYLGEYLDEFCYRFNRRRWEGELFGRLVNACLAAKPLAAPSRAT